MDPNAFPKVLTSFLIRMVLREGDSDEARGTNFMFDGRGL